MIVIGIDNEKIIKQYRIQHRDDAEYGIVLF